MLTIVALLHLGLLSGFTLPESEGIHFKTDLNEAIAEAQKTNKPIFLDAYATWCGWCKKMDQDVFQNNEVAAYYNSHFVNVKVNFDKKQDLKKKYKVRGYPTQLFLKSDGSLKSKHVGYMQADAFIKKGKKHS
jgi:thiol:disulfide interchange protein